MMLGCFLSWYFCTVRLLFWGLVFLFFMSNVVCNVCCEWYEGMCGYVVLSYKVVVWVFLFLSEGFYVCVVFGFGAAIYVCLIEEDWFCCFVLF